MMITSEMPTRKGRAFGCFIMPGTYFASKAAPDALLHAAGDIKAMIGGNRTAPFLSFLSTINVWICA